MLSDTASRQSFYKRREPPSLSANYVIATLGQQIYGRVLGKDHVNAMVTIQTVLPEFKARVSSFDLISFGVSDGV